MELQVFMNAEFGPIRSGTVDGEIYFVGKDVAEILGYSSSCKALLDHVAKEDKTDEITIHDSMGREQNPIMIKESGLYSLILSSKLPTASRFKKWVTSEVLPTIRKHGVYALEAEKEVQKLQLIEMQLKANYYDVVLNSPDLVSVTEIAKDYGWSARRMNEYLHEQRIQFKQRGRIWILYQKYAQQGYTSTKTYTYMDSNGINHTKVHTYWTQKGRLFIYDLLKAEGIFPLIEQERKEC